MQTLNVGAGRTDEEYKAAEEQRRADLLADSGSDANYFFWAAGLAALSTGLLPVRLNILVNIGAFDLLGLYGRSVSALYPFAMYGAVVAWLAMLLALGFAARGGHRWAFLAGMVLYGADMIALMVTFSLWAFGVHAFFVFRWFQGQKALKDLDEAGARPLEVGDPKLVLRTRMRQFYKCLHR
ncbi:MAG TPA: hypothetical protein VK706_16095 [Candidatus Sulfotelmatobacter sp.]|jgi:hypothetical protein|nr:hypothetical protein [Candidatus Sulfotelmatobacter sp.]